MPTIVEDSIGTGGDYTTVTLWEGDTDDGDLTSLDERRRGLLRDQEHAFAGSRVTLNGPTTSATQYREIAPESDAVFDPTDESGARITFTGSNGAFYMIEANFRIGGGIGFINNGASVNQVIQAATAPAIIDGVTIINRGSSTLTYAIQGTFSMTPDVIVRNVLIIHDSAATISTCIRYGGEISNVTVYKTSGSGSIFNFLQGHASAQATAVNCAVFGVSNDPFPSNTTGTFAVSDFAIAGGEGTGSLTATDIFEDPENFDFEPKSSGDAYQSGSDLSSDFTNDLHGRERTDWDIGAVASDDSIALDPTGTAPLSGAAAEMAASGSLAFSGSSVLSAAPAETATSGVESMDGTAVMEAAAAETEGTGTGEDPVIPPVSGTSSQAAEPATMASSGSLGIAGTSELAAPAATAATAGEEEFTGTSVLASEAATAAMAGASGTKIAIVKTFAAWLCTESSQDDSMYLDTNRTRRYTIGSLADKTVAEDLTPYGDIKWTLSRISPSGQILTSAPVVEKKLSAGTLTADTLTDGVVDVPLLNSDTESLTPGTYHTELEVFDVFGESAVVAVGTLTLLANVTNT